MADRRRTKTAGRKVSGVKKPVATFPQKNWASHQLALRVIATLETRGCINIVLRDSDIAAVAQAIRDYRSEERKVN